MPVCEMYLLLFLCDLCKSYAEENHGSVVHEFQPGLHFPKASQA